MALSVCLIIFSRNCVQTIWRCLPCTQQMENDRFMRCSRVDEQLFLIRRRGIIWLLCALPIFPWIVLNQGPLGKEGRCICLQYNVMKCRQYGKRATWRIQTIIIVWCSDAIFPWIDLNQRPLHTFTALKMIQSMPYNLPIKFKTKQHHKKKGKERQLIKIKIFAKMSNSDFLRKSQLILDIFIKVRCHHK